MPSIFLCHSSQDKFFVWKLVEQLKAHSIRVWLDEAELNIGDSLTEKIGRAIDEADFVGVVLSRNSVNSEWVQKELQVAMQKELAERQVVVLPLLLEPVDLPPVLRDKLYADFTTPEKFEETFPRLLKTLGVEIVEDSSQPFLHQDDTGVKEIDPTAGRVQLSEPQQMSTPAAHRLAQFEDIRILDLDDKRSYRPDLTKALYSMYLEISAVPSQEWQQIFEAERSFPRHTMWRRAWIEGQYIVIHCVPVEIEEYHLRDLQEDVGNTNSKYRQYLIQQAQAEAKKLQEEQSERQQLTALRQRLRKELPSYAPESRIGPKLCLVPHWESGGGYVPVPIGGKLDLKAIGRGVHIDYFECLFSLAIENQGDEIGRNIRLDLRVENAASCRIEIEKAFVNTRPSDTKNWEENYTGFSWQLGQDFVSHPTAPLARIAIMKLIIPKSEAGKIRMTQFSYQLWADGMEPVAGNIPVEIIWTREGGYRG